MRIIDGKFIKSLADVGQGRDIAHPEICFVGRSNVGKSSLVNSLVMSKIARTGSTPGATRLINLYDIRYEWQGARRNAIFSDFPGFGFSKVSRNVYENWQGMIEGYITGNDRIRHVLWVFDVRRDFDELDRMLLEWLRENDRGFSLVLNKADKEGRGKLLQKKQTLQEVLGNDDVFLFSSKDGQGKKELTAHLLSIVSDRAL